MQGRAATTEQEAPDKVGQLYVSPLAEGLEI